MNTKQTKLLDSLQPKLYPCECGKYAAVYGERRCQLCERKHRRRMFGRTRCWNCGERNPNAKRGAEFCSPECALEYESRREAGEDPDMAGLTLTPWPLPKRTSSVNVAPPPVAPKFVSPLVVEEAGGIPAGNHFEGLCYCRADFLSPPCHYVRTGEMKADDPDPWLDKLTDIAAGKKGGNDV